jgi:hypothetical protein
MRQIFDKDVVKLLIMRLIALKMVIILNERFNCERLTRVGLNERWEMRDFNELIMIIDGLKLESHVVRLVQRCTLFEGFLEGK